MPLSGHDADAMARSAAGSRSRHIVYGEPDACLPRALTMDWIPLCFREGDSGSGMRPIVRGWQTCAEQEAPSPAPAKAAQEHLDIKFEQADVTQLQYQDKQFDIVSISFGIRNVNNPVKALQEMARVTKPGGRVMVLEFGQMQIPLIGGAYKFYSEKILPILGGWVTGQKDAYEYLQKSSAAFPCREGFLDLMKQAGSFSDMKYVPVSLGIAYIYIGTVK